MKKTVLALLLSGTALAAQAAVTGSAGIASDYRFRGISQTQGAAAVQAGVEYQHGTGLYIGNWNSSVSAQAYGDKAGTEHDIYAGLRKNFGSITADVGAISYRYAGASTANTDEVYAGLSWQGISVKASHAYSSGYFGAVNNRGTQYYEVNVAQPLTKAITLVAHAGRTDVANTAGSDYTDLNAGLTTKIAGFDVAARYYVNDSMTAAFKAANTVAGKKNFDSGVAVTVSREF